MKELINQTKMKELQLHNTVFPGHVTRNMYEYRGVGIFQHGARYRIDFAMGNKWVSSLELAKRVIDMYIK